MRRKSTEDKCAAGEDNFVATNLRRERGREAYNFAMRGIRFVTDENGNRVAVQLDLDEWGELWEDIYDNLVADERRGETTVSLDEVEQELRAEGRLRSFGCDTGVPRTSN